MPRRKKQKRTIPAILLAIGISIFLVWQYGKPVFDVIAYGTPLKETAIFILATIGIALIPKVVQGPYAHRIGT